MLSSTSVACSVTESRGMEDAGQQQRQLQQSRCCASTASMGAAGAAGAAAAAAGMEGPPQARPLSQLGAAQGGQQVWMRTWVAAGLGGGARAIQTWAAPTG